MIIMKNINTYINERLHITTNSHLHRYTCQPKTTDELQKIIIQRIKDDGSECDLNDIDVSKITDMSELFNMCEKFNGDISRWNVSNVKNMAWMFYECKEFNCDISKWDVSNVTNMDFMFYRCEKFKQNLDDWNVSNVDTNNMWCTFGKCPTQPKWYKE